MASISQKTALKKYALCSAGKIRKYPEICKQLEIDILKIYATFSNMCVGVHTGEVFGINNQMLANEFKRKITNFN